MFIPPFDTINIFNLAVERLCIVQNYVCTALNFYPMSQVDKERTLKGSNGLFFNRSQWDKYNANSAQRAAAMDTIAAGVGSVTSRDQIINPQSMIDPSMYENTRAGRAQYESDLAALTNFQSQQEAAYQEWYESPEQAALRERAAGLNPDLVGLENAGESAEAPVSDAVPGANLPTNGQMVFNAFSAFSGIIQNASSLALLPSSISSAKAGANLANANANLANSHATAIDLATIQSAEASYYDAASNILADAVAADPGLDVSAFMSDMNNFSGVFETFAPGISSSHPLYSSYQGAFKRALGSVQKAKAGAMGINTDAAAGQTEFAKALANKYFDPNLRLQIGLIEPLANSEAELYELDLQFQILSQQFETSKLNSLDPETAASSIMAGYSATIAEQNFKKDYFDGFDGDEAAALDYAMKQYQDIIMRIDSSTKQNLWDIYSNKSLSMQERLSAFYNLAGNTHSSFAEFAIQRYPTLAVRWLNGYADKSYSEGRNAKIEPFIRLVNSALGAGTTYATFGVK